MELPSRLPIVATLAVAALLTGACSSDGGDGAAPEPSATTAKVIDYEQDAGDPVSVRKPADVVKLEGAPEAFRQYVAGLIDATAEAPLDGDCPPVEVSVNVVHPDGYASGAVLACGGAAYMWAERDGVWQRIWGGQDLPACADMKKFSVPQEVAGDECYDGKQAVPYKG